MITESEVIDILRSISISKLNKEDAVKVIEARTTAIAAIIENQAYRAIGTIERFRELTENNNRIIEILRTHRFTDEECIEKITEIVGIHSQN